MISPHYYGSADTNPAPIIASDPPLTGAMHVKNVVLNWTELQPTLTWPSDAKPTVYLSTLLILVYACSQSWTWTEAGWIVGIHVVNWIYQARKRA